MQHSETDKALMRDAGKITLYLVRGPKLPPKLGSDDRVVAHLVNWDASLSIPTRRIKRSPHNIARYRYDTWFVFEGDVWHGVQYGDMTQLCHCKRTKTKA